MSNHDASRQLDLTVTGDENTLLPGDILLVTSAEKIPSAVNRYGQGVLSGRLRSKFSHVALNLGGGVIAESLTEGGVKLKTVQDFKANTDIDGGIVLRPVDRAPLSELDSVFRRARYYHGARYNWLFLLPKLAHRQFSHLFCSEFVSRVYRELGYADFQRRRPERVLPIHFEQLFKDPRWKTFQLAEMLKDPPPPRYVPGELGGLEHDPRIKGVLSRIKQYEDSFARREAMSREHLGKLLETNEGGAELSRAMDRYVALQLPRREALLKKLRACGDIAQQKEVLKQDGMEFDWTTLPTMASFLDGLPKTQTPPAFVWENARDRERLIDRTIRIYILIATMIVGELADLVTVLEQKLVFPADYAGDNQAVAVKMANAIKFLGAVRGDDAGMIATGGLRVQIADSLIRAADAMNDYAGVAADDPRLELWLLLARASMGLLFVEMLMPFKPDADAKEQIAAILAIGETFERHRSDADTVRGDQNRNARPAEQTGQNGKGSWLARLFRHD